ncbi:hypothetical protein QTP70_007629 [Hemibagrus guttatus]|uniref:Alkylated DNA repair protein AlkB homologue 8 N-terminal domain-containing protein n=1 Tax=Hemibagrus guttatus TaxID=175788 RepID=A0AAE0PVD7_9TELE|nr:hypothetical protein QTP70_007629 [Hemibagrus guttatus]
MAILRLFIDGTPVEIVKSTKFLGVHLAENFTWLLNTTSITKKAQQHLYFLQRLRKAHLPPPILTMFYRGTIESILSSCITAWFGNCTVSDPKTLQRIVRTADSWMTPLTPHTHSSLTCCLERDEHLCTSILRQKHNQKPRADEELLFAAAILNKMLWGNIQLQHANRISASSQHPEACRWAFTWSVFD